MIPKGLGAWFRAQGGLTLIEMTVVIAVSAGLASIALPNVRGLIWDGRGAGKVSGIRELTLGVVRYLEKYRQFPTADGGLPPVSVRDFDHDGTIRLTLDTAQPDGDGDLPGNIDVTCVTGSTQLADAVQQCFFAVDFAKVREFNYGFPEHAFDDVLNELDDVPTFDGDQATVDFVARDIDRFGHDIEIYVIDDGGSGTPFPPGAMLVWNLTEDAKPTVLKSDPSYGRQ